MYNYINGRIVEQNSNYIVLDCSGIGYQIHVSNPFEFELDHEEKVYVYQHITEDAETLYGFKTIDQKNLFLKLIGVKGVGPKLVLPMLATGSVSGIIDAIDRENILYLKKFPKIGDKVAKQMILDLKGKLAVSIDSSPSGGFEELVSVLEGLGYKTVDIKKILPNMDANKPIETQVKEALKLLLK